MLRRFAKIFIPIAIIGMIGVGLFREEISGMTVASAASRQIDFICQNLAAGRVSRAELCSSPLESIPSLSSYYERLESRDAEWYAEHGMSFQAKVNCEADPLVFELLGYRFHCEGDEAALVGEGSNVKGVAEAQEPVRSCYQTAEHNKTTMGTVVEDDGTILFESKQRVALVGVELPSGDDAESDEGKCRAHAMRYLRSQIVDRQVVVYPQDVQFFDDKYRIPSYLVLENGQLLNREMLRLGFGRYKNDYPDTFNVGCKDLLEQSELFARRKKLGVWGDMCS